ncbi:hypothetical protein FRC03_000982 [Tulasnella sp. 419]|nr:hypothetical protein FRC03_000982 [Tulasnella sp. 419]
MSSNLLDIADRLSYNISRVQEAASKRDSRPVVGRFTTALLSGKDPNKPVTDFVRDALPGEPRLLSIDAGTREEGDGRTTPTKNDNEVLGLGGGVGDLVGMGQLTRRQIVSATPLRRKQEIGPGGEGGDVFLKSALKIIDRYQSMPRARAHVVSLLERYNELVESTYRLKKQVQEIQASIPAHQQHRTDQFISHKQAEQGVRDVEAKVAEARRKRDALKLRLHNLKNPGATSQSEDSSVSVDSSLMSSILGTGSEIDTSSLNNEGMPSGLDFGNSLYMSSSRTPTTKKQVEGVDAAEAAFWSGGGKQVKNVEPNEEQDETAEDEEESEDEDVDDADDQVEEQEETVVLSLAKPLPPRERSPEPLILQEPAPAQAEEKKGVNTKETLPQGTSQISTTTAPTQHQPEPSSRPPQVIPEQAAPSSRSGPELEATVVKIWKTVGDVFLPGHSYDIGSGGEKLPKLKETLEILEVQTTTSSPNVALTAQLLITMLNSSTTSVPMPQIKGALEDLGNKRGFDKPVDLGVKAVYACVAKKLLKIDRRAREHTVTFDAS